MMASVMGSPWWADVRWSGRWWGGAIDAAGDPMVRSSEGPDEEQDVEGHQAGGDEAAGRGDRRPAGERAHEPAVGGQGEEGDDGEGDAEGQDRLGDEERSGEGHVAAEDGEGRHRGDRPPDPQR